MEDHGSLPPGYGENRLVALVQGPGVVYVYWELSPELWRLLNAAGSLVLRLFEVSGGQSAVLEEITLGWHTGGRYFRRVGNDRDYRCELGRWENEMFYSYLSSEPVATPSQEVANDAGRRFMVPIPFKAFQRDDHPGSSGFGPEGEGRR